MMYIINKRPPDGFNVSHARFTVRSSEGDPETGTNIDEKFIVNFKIQAFLAVHRGLLGLIHLQF